MSAARLAYVRGRQAEGARDPRFHVWQEGGVLVAASPDRGVRGRFLSDGLEVSTDRAHGRLRTRSLRCDGRLTPAGAPPFAVTSAPHRVERRIAEGSLAVTEWIESGPLGLEHGFDVDGRCDALSIDIEVEGLRIERSAEDVRLVSQDGSFAYGELFAVDAAGRVLPARFVVDAANIRLEVDTSTARWPVTVDPLVYVEEQRVDLPSALGTDGRRGDWFGSAVAVDGELALVGAYRDHVGGHFLQGSVYVVERIGDFWQLQSKLVASDGQAGDNFGYSVAISGRFALVGARGSTEHGAAYVFERVGSSWIERAKLVPSDGDSSDEFGASVALDDGMALVGAPQDDDVAADAGAVYAFMRTGERWELHEKITVGTVRTNHRFGWSVALDGATAIVGAIEGRGGSPGPGSAYVFQHADAWTLQTRLVASDASARGFGWSVDVSRDSTIVGAPAAGRGVAYVFERAGGRWSEEATITVAELVSGDRFGASVSLHGRTALIGAARRDGAVTNGAAAYVFVRGSGWVRQAELRPAVEGSSSFGDAVALFNGAAWVGADHDEEGRGSATVFQREATDWPLSTRIASQPDLAVHFGYSLVIDGDTALVAAPVGPLGQVHVFVRSGDTWRWQATLSAPDAGNQFGASVALHGDTALIGFAEDTRQGPGTGAAYVFVRDGERWFQQAKLVASDAAAHDRFGVSVALRGDTAMIGAEGHDAASPNGGAVYVFTRSADTWVESSKLTRIDCPSLGHALALDESTLVASGQSNAEGFPGYLCTFARSGGTWTHESTTLLDTPERFSRFGDRVAIHGETLLVSAPRDRGSRGAVYVFDRVRGGWVEGGTLVASDGAFEDYFGSSVALSGDVAVIGAPQDDDLGYACGAFYVFVRTAGEWVELFKRSGTSPGDELGTAVAVDDDIMLVGAPRVDGLVPFGSPEDGAAYFGRLLSSDGTECDVDTSCASGFCVDGVCCNSPCGAGSDDDCEACSVAAGGAHDGVCGSTTGNACDDGVSCTVGDSCDAGVCSGAVICISCPAGTWSENGSDQTPCLPCEAGTWSAAGARECVGWAECASGSFVVSSGSASEDRTCGTCPLGTFSTSSNSAACVPWSTCGEGSFEAVAGTSTGDRVCQLCTLCRGDEREAEACSSTRDTVCVRRDAGVAARDGGSSTDAGGHDAGVGELDGAIVVSDAGDASFDADTDVPEGGVVGGGGCSCTSGTTGGMPSPSVLLLFVWLARRSGRRLAGVATTVRSRSRRCPRD
ncbi:MAG: hypothetical protein H6722_29735 [Sandaracinus sp.]|nr:hypothetical protein [Sandaracinus sp.]